MGLMNVVRQMNTSPQVLNIHRFFEITFLIGCSQREKRQGIKARNFDDVFQLEGIKFIKRNIIEKRGFFEVRSERFDFCAVQYCY